MIEVEWWEYDDPAEMVEAVAGDIGFIIESALDARGEALIALPGGDAHAPIFQKLASAKLKWKHVTIIPTDDRLVPVDSPMSNVGSIARHFLPKGARVLPITADAAADYRAAGKAADARVQALKWPPDLVWLDVGADGHAASIFPGPDLEEALEGPKSRLALGVMPEPLPADAPVPRVTLSRSGILSARTLTMAFTGSDKRAVVEQAIKDGPLSNAPIGRILSECELPIDIHWYAGE
jgi:6-phosphogluconolactonase